MRDSLRFWGSVDGESEDSCWVWLGPKNKNGYGLFNSNRVRRMAHRVSYEQLVGPIPEGLVLDHLCRNRACVNPKHLEPVTIAENVKRGVRTAPLMSEWRYCKRGHEFTEANTRWVVKPERTQRLCRECQNLRARETRRLSRLPFAK